MAAAVGSGVLNAPVELGAVWAAIWELTYPLLPQTKPDWCHALTVLPSAEPAVPELTGTRVALLVLGLKNIASRQAIIEQLARYPTARGGMPEVIPADPHDLVITEAVAGFEQVAPRIIWHASDRTPQVLGEMTDRVAPPYKTQWDRALIPALPTGDFLQPIMLWWLLLFGLSNLARYEPATWTAALDLNRSPLAVPLESAMQEALDSVPHFILEAMLGRFVERHSY